MGEKKKHFLFPMQEMSKDLHWWFFSVTFLLFELGEYLWL
jgi:hypothetical protein